MALHPADREGHVSDDSTFESDPIQRALQENEDWNRDLVEHSEDLLCIHDLQGRLLAINPSSARILGYARDELMRLPMRELLAPEFQPHFDDYLKEIVEAGEARGFMAVLTRTGERRIWEYRNTLRTEGVVSPIVRGMARDVTEQKKAEKALLLLKDELSAEVLALNQLHELNLRLSGMTDLQTMLEEILSETMRLQNADFGLVKIFNTETQRLDVTAYRGFDEDSIVQIRAGNDPAAAGLRAIRSRTRILIEDVESYPASASYRRLAEAAGFRAVQSTPLFARDGEPLGVLSTQFRQPHRPTERELRLTDLYSRQAEQMIERKRAEENLQGYRMVIEGLEEMIVVVDRNYRYLIANQAFLRNRGMTREGVVGHAVPEVVDKQVFDHVIKEKMDECFTGKVVRYELRYNVPNLGQRDISVSYFPIEGANGIDRLACILRDITERRKSDERLREYEKALEGLEEMIVVVRRDYRYLMANHAFLKYKGATREQVIGHSVAEVLEKKAFEDVVRPRLDECFRGNVVRYEMQLEHPGMGARDLHISYFPIEGPTGVESAACVLRDVTELKRGETNLRNAVEELRLAQEKLAEEKVYLEEEIDAELGFGEIVGNSAPLRAVMEQVSKVATSDATVLVMGETGTGKELVARAIHRLSTRHDSSFIKMNCAAIPSGLLESELFGHERGAFTGAVTKKIGRLELADHGTLFLDEIGEIPLAMQPKLLRVLQDQEFERLGGTHTLKVDFRLIAATNRDLWQVMNDRQFRSDLYYRLNVFPVRVPSLRERREDIPLLIDHFVRKCSVRLNKTITSVPKKTMEMLERWDWPGNIRELENFIERSVILTQGTVLQAPLKELERLESAREEDDDDSGDDTLEAMEREHIIRALQQSHGRLSGIKGAAKRLGMNRTTLQSKLKRLGIDHLRYRD